MGDKRDLDSDLDSDLDGDLDGESDRGSDHGGDRGSDGGSNRGTSTGTGAGRGAGPAAGHYLGLISFAHRGAPAWYQRENTVRAFKRALAHRATGLESDVWLTADGVAALHHDGIVGAGGRRVSDTDSSRLPHWLPTLAELYEACGTNFELSLDIKGPPGRTVEAAAAVVEAARKAGGTDAIVRTWLCGNLDELTDWRRIDTDVRLVNSTSLREVRALGGFATYSARLTDSGVAAVNLRAREWTEQAANEGLPVLRDAGLRAFGWGAQSNRTLRRLVRFGLNGIYSDHLARLVTVTEPDGRSNVN